MKSTSGRWQHTFGIAIAALALSGAATLAVAPGAVASPGVTAMATPGPGDGADPGATADPAAALPVVFDISGSGDAGSLVTLPLSVGPTVLIESVQLIDPTSGDLVGELDVAGEGTWTVHTELGSMRFAPVDGFAGAATPVAYTAFDAAGVQAEPAAASVTIRAVELPAGPLDGPEVATTDFGTPVAIDPFANFVPGEGAGVDRASFVFLSGPELQLSADGASAMTTDGTFTFDSATGLVTFVPADGFTGDTVSVGYSIADTTGVRTSSSLAVSVTPPVLDAQDQVASEPAFGETSGAAPEQATPAREVLPVTGEGVSLLSSLVGAVVLLAGALLLLSQRRMRHAR